MTQTGLGLVEAMQELARRGLNVGAAGNASVRRPHGFEITPSAVATENLSAALLVECDLRGSPMGHGKPSSEWRLHRDLYLARPEIGAIVHCHSPFATALACTGRDIPAFHYMVARLGGADVRCGAYALFGSEALSSIAVAAIHERRGCLLANHGQLAVGHDLTEALATAIELESLAHCYGLALAMGGVRLLSPQEMQEAIDQFMDYRPGLLNG